MRTNDGATGRGAEADFKREVEFDGSVCVSIGVVAETTDTGEVGDEERMGKSFPIEVPTDTLFLPIPKPDLFPIPIPTPDFQTPAIVP